MTHTNPDAATAVALIRAAIADDTTAQAAILNTTDPAALLAATTGVLLVLATEWHGDLGAFDQRLAAWQNTHTNREIR